MTFPSRTTVAVCLAATSSMAHAWMSGFAVVRIAPYARTMLTELFGSIELAHVNMTVGAEADVTGKARDAFGDCTESDISMTRTMLVLATV
eukprot:CAMPEP_0172749330 /NCGR_PEP_ID=MMETSP1074-20121228/147100_1 /TAXON_ID=2916 /ORGANISM="Ceratium fusus, Strain PA161109" /LENGTH=90 /DNA_ID=CAMNT_0013581267 /DNA_START=14 /DNA_END=283 /DNA_ORIENTATION=+